jgi:branched-chain amino acid aminotransferase
METHPEGASLCRSDIPVKGGSLASVKSCNYLPNVQLKQAAIQAGTHFAYGLDEQGLLAEGATENLGIVDREGRLALPEPGRILDGTTMLRAFDLAAELVTDGLLAGRERRGITPDDLAHAREILIFGTTTDVTSVTSLDGTRVANGTPGPVAKALSTRYLQEQNHPPTPHHLSLG